MKKIFTPSEARRRPGRQFPRRVQFLGYRSGGPSGHLAQGGGGIRQRLGQTASSVDVVDHGEVVLGVDAREAQPLIGAEAAQQRMGHPAFHLLRARRAGGQ